MDDHGSFPELSKDYPNLAAATYKNDGLMMIFCFPWKDAFKIPADFCCSRVCDFACQVGCFTVRNTIEIPFPEMPRKALRFASVGLRDDYAFIEKAHVMTRWWFQRFFMFIPIWGNDPILTNIFQMGWFNHQLVMHFFVSWNNHWGRTHILTLLIITENPTIVSSFVWWCLGCS